MNKFLLSALFCLIIYFFVKNDGLIDYYQTNQSYHKLLNQKYQLNQELAQLKKENNLLKNNKRYIEKVAREEYFYIYPDEIIITFD
ncbi:septum formation initiator family protein [bacterium]|nr:MAG: septum formation initiator family protein [bacterium]